MEVQNMNGGSKDTEVQQVLHMNGGAGKTSYAQNSAAQNKIISKVKPIIEKAVMDLYCTTFPDQSIGIADLGCSSGPNTLLVVSEIMNIFDRSCRQLGRSSPEFSVFLNDLPGNDFNTVFKSLPAFYENLRKEKGEKFGQCFIAGVPGSFYGRLFPSRSLHFVHSSSSLHWLSQVPPELDAKVNIPLNKGKIYISKTSPASVSNAYFAQFQRDLSLFLKSRSEEIVPEGRMVLTFLGRRDADPTSEESCYLWELLAQSLGDLVMEGHVEEETLDSFNAPYYAPSPEEIESEIQKEGSFQIDRLEIVALDWIEGFRDETSCDKRTSVLRMGKAIRAVSESMLRKHFGEVMDPLFQRFGERLASSTKEVKHISFTLSMIRKKAL